MKVHRTNSEDDAFVEAFEQCRIELERFDHAAHVRLAYAYLCNLDHDMQSIPPR